MKKRVLIISTSAGTGHVRAAQALEKEFAADPRVDQVIHADALKFTNKLFRDFYSTLYMKLVRDAPDVLGWVYRASDEPWKGESARSQLDRLNTQRLIKFIREFDPHITVCTHFMPAGIISHLVQKKQLETHHSIVVTDFDCHAMWLSRTFHRFFVALDETKAHLEALGLPSERITVSGIPIGQLIDVEPNPSPAATYDIDNFGANTSGFTFAALGDVIVGQEVSLQELPASTGSLIVAGRVQLESSRITARLSNVTSSKRSSPLGRSTSTAGVPEAWINSSVSRGSSVGTSSSPATRWRNSSRTRRNSICGSRRVNTCMIW